jgi:serine/threonine protein kinase
MVKRKFLGNGSYGCVFSPPLTCNKGERENEEKPIPIPMVGKVFFTDEYFRSELELIKFVKKTVDPESKFTMPLSATCAIARPHPKETVSTAPEACKSFQGREKQFIYPDGGNDLKHFALKNKRKPKAFFKLFKALRPIFEGLVTMTQKQVAHCDIKPDNILYNPKTKRTILIDYGLMTTFDNMYKDIHGSDSLKDADYMYFPIEFKMHSLLRLASSSRQLNHNTLLRSFKESYAHVGDPALFFNIFHVDLVRDIKTLCHSKTPKGFYHTSKLSLIDVYAFGITLAEIMRTMRLAQFEATDYTKYDGLKLILIKQLVHHMIRPNLYERWFPEQCLAYYDEIIKLL